MNKLSIAMHKIDKILSQTDHRPWTIPTKRWMYYQEWNEVLFLHWEVDPELLREYLPDNLKLDLHQEKAWVSLVPFTMEKIRPFFLPYFAPISNFHEINLRTYVIKDGKRGVYFINIGAEKWLSTLLSKQLSGLPYEKAQMKRRFIEMDQTYASFNKNKAYEFSATFTTFPRTSVKSDLEIWLTERYCLYVEEHENLYRYDIHHLEWALENVQIHEGTFKLNYNLGAIKLQTMPDLVNYSKGIQVVAWGKVLL